MDDMIKIDSIFSESPRELSGEATKLERSRISDRPMTFDEYPGQHKVKENLKVYVQSAKNRSEPLDHIILHGPPGLGKTTLAKIVSNELGVSFYQASGPAVDKPGDLAGILAGIEENGVLFIDEIHRMPIQVEEILYSAMEDFFVDIMIGQGPTARSVQMPVQPFTLIGATTRMASLSAPLISRFGIQEHLEFYDLESLSQIIAQTADKAGYSISRDASIALAQRSRGTPRIAKRLLRRVRDFADFEGLDIISEIIVEKTLDRLDIDKNGLDHMDRKVLLTIKERYNGGPVGIETLSATIGEDRNTIEEVYEPFLLHQGFIQRGPRGRELTEKGYKHFE